MPSPAFTVPYRIIDWLDNGALESAIEAHFALKRESVKDELAMYRINEAFGGKDPYWKIHNRPDRFASTEENGVLYRPEIVDDIVGMIEYSLYRRMGVMVRGPHGVGKSLSLVNVVRKLESTGNYLVTFIPDCQTWLTGNDIYDAICHSFGSTKEALNLDMDSYHVGNIGMLNCDGFINAMKTILERQDKQWVLIFDQVNCLFEICDRNDVGSFRFPFYFIAHSCRNGRITSVISVSADNETNYEEDQRGFNYYDHPLEMDSNELLLAFPQLMDKSDTDLNNLVKLTGTMPLQVYLFVQAGNDEKYRTEELKRIATSLQRLKDGTRFGNQTFFWECIVKTAIWCFLQKKERFGCAFFDRNLSVMNQMVIGETLFVPVNPLVVDVYEEFFRDDLMDYVELNEGRLLRLCRDPQVPDDLRGRIFKLLELVWARTDCMGEVVGTAVSSTQML